MNKLIQTDTARINSAADRLTTEHTPQHSAISDKIANDFRHLMGEDTEKGGSDGFLQIPASVDEDKVKNAQSVISGAQYLTVGTEDNRGQKNAFPQNEPARPAGVKNAFPQNEPARPAGQENAFPQKEPARPAGQKNVFPQNEPARPAGQENAFPQNEPARPAGQENAFPQKEATLTAGQGNAFPQNEPARPAGQENAFPQNEPARPAGQENAFPQKEATLTAGQENALPQNKAALTAEQAMLLADHTAKHDKQSAKGNLSDMTQAIEPESSKDIDENALAGMPNPFLRLFSENMPKMQSSPTEAVPSSSTAELAEKLVERILVSQPDKNGQEIRLQLSQESGVNAEVRIVRGLDGSLAITMHTKDNDSFQNLVAAQDRLKATLDTHERGTVRVEVLSETEQENNDANRRSRGYMPPENEE